jgi:hypothetical protein
VTSQHSINILDALVEYKDFHSSIILSYGANLPFYEKGVLTRLWKSNSRNNLVFMDSVRYQDTVINCRDTIGYVGKRYLVIPVDLGFFQSYHPKLILLLGTDRARMLVGSGNLTFSGYGDNLETFTQFDWPEKQSQNLILFAYVWDLIRTTQKRWGFSDQASRMLDKAQYQSLWLQEATELANKSIISSLDAPLIEGIQSILDGRKINNLTILSPFLDEKVQAIKALYRAFNPSEINLILQSDYSVANPKAIEKLMNMNIPLTLSKAIEQDRYIHAKAYLFETEDSVMVFSGSANCTKAGLLSNATNGNFELLTIREFANKEEAISYLESGVRFVKVDSVEKLKLKPPTSFETKERPSIRLLDVAIDGPYLIVKFKIKELPKNIKSLTIISDFPKPIQIKIPEFSIGLNDIRLLLEKEFLILTTGIFSLSLRGLNGEGETTNTDSNSLWVTNQTELNKKISFITPDDETSAKLLGEKLLKDDRQWSSLYKTLVGLVELDVGQIKKVSLSTIKRPRKNEGKNNQDKESTIVILNETSFTDDRQAEIEAEINKESRIHSWLEIVLGMFPLEKPPGRTPQKGGDGGTRPAPKKPNQNIGKKFTRLVKRYIRTIHNIDFMQSVSAYYLLAYYSIFQRITWLLFSSNVISKDEYLQYSLEIFHGYFGSISDNNPPFFLPTIENHLRWRYETQWQETQAHVHALANIYVLKDLFSSDDGIVSCLNSYLVHLLSCLCCIIPPHQILIDLDDIDAVAKYYDYDAVEFNDALSKLVKNHLPTTINVLNEWILQSNISLFGANESLASEHEILFNTRISLGIGSRRIKKHLGKDNLDDNWLSLIHWCNIVDRGNPNSNYLHKLISVFRIHDFFSLLPKALYDLAKKAKEEEKYEDSMELLEQALLVTDEKSDSPSKKVILFYKDMVNYLLSIK